MSTRPPARGNKRGVIFAAVLLTLFVLFTSARFYTDVLWFDEVGFTSVLWTSLRTQFLVGLGVGVLTAAIVWANLKIAERIAPAYRPGNLSLAGRMDPMQRYREQLLPFARWIRLAVAVTVGLLSGFGASTAWQTFLLWSNRVSFGASDPQFGKDIGFYVFELPFLNQISDWIWFALIASLVLSLGAHYFYGSIRPEIGWRGVLSGALAHVSVLLGLLALVKAAQYWLGTYGLNFSERGVVTGASYTDVEAQLPALRLLAIISVVSALLFLVNIRVRRLSLPLTAIAIWLFFSLAAGTLWPLAIQQFSVEPQEPQREEPYIRRNIDMTRAGFDLSEVEVQDYPGTGDLTAEEAEANGSALQNVRLWDPGVLQQAYAQLQSIRTYYRFEDVDVDRYEVGGEPRQVLLSARELSLEDAETSRSWQNRHLVYTHGFGLVASLANASTSAGQPSFLVRDVPGQAVEGAESLQVDQPRIYFGEGFDADEYSVVRSKQQETDYPLEGGEVQRSTYEGVGGVPVGNLFRRLAFAVRESDPNLVLSGLISGDSRILVYRNVRDRVRRAAPFLRLDSDPYLAVIDGRLLWIIDGYTATEWYPYSQRFDAGEVVDSSESGALDGRMNYVRNSVKVTVDAYDGTMNFHIVDPEDPRIHAWAGACPALFTAGAPSEDLRAHFRYPEDLFKMQSEVYRRYHMDSPIDFYSNEDAEVPQSPTVSGFGSTEAADTAINPVYLLRSAGGDRAGVRPLPPLHPEGPRQHDLDLSPARTPSITASSCPCGSRRAPSPAPSRSTTSSTRTQRYHRS